MLANVPIKFSEADKKRVLEMARGGMSEHDICEAFGYASDSSGCVRLTNTLELIMPEKEFLRYYIAQHEGNPGVHARLDECKIRLAALRYRTDTDTVKAIIQMHRDGMSNTGISKELHLYIVKIGNILEDVLGHDERARFSRKLSAAEQTRRTEMSCEYRAKRVPEDVRTEMAFQFQFGDGKAEDIAKAHHMTLRMFYAVLHDVYTDAEFDAIVAGRRRRAMERAYADPTRVQHLHTRLDTLCGECKRWKRVDKSDYSTILPTRLGRCEADGCLKRRTAVCNCGQFLKGGKG